MFCIECGQQLSGDSLFCTSCGAKTAAPDNQTTEASFCTECGQEITDDSAFCTSCGAKVAVNEAPPQDQPAPLESPVNPTVEEPNDLDSWLEETAAARESQPPQPEPLPYTPPVKPAEPVPQPGPVPPVSQPPPETTAKDTAKQRKRIRTLSGVAVILLFVIIGLAAFIILGRRDPAPEGGPEYYIHRVVNGHVGNRTGTNIGTAFDRHFTNPTWDHFIDGTINNVNFRGEMIHNNQPALVQMIFRFTEDDRTFDIIGMIIGGAWQDTVTMNDILDDIFVRGRR